MTKILRVALPLVIVVSAVLAARIIIASRDEPVREPPRPSPPLVEVVELHPAPYQVRLQSRGTVQPRTESELVPQVGGVVIDTSENFRDGAFFEAGERLLRIDPRDYEIAVRIAEADLVQARLQLAQEEARAQQAARDLGRLELDQPPTDLALRKPQLAGARAALSAAGSRLAQARLNLERTEIRAPYAGRVLEQRADIGQTVAPGNVLGRIYATDYVEVRLPLTNQQLAHVDLPGRYRQPTDGKRVEPAVTLSARIGGSDVTWTGRVVRSEGAIDASSRQIFVIAQVDDPYAADETGRPPLKIGQFVEAVIHGNRFEAAYQVPRIALTPDNRILTVTGDDRLLTQTPRIAWKDDSSAVVLEGLQPGVRVVTSALPLATDGMPVRVHDPSADAPTAQTGAAPGKPGS